MLICDTSSEVYFIDMLGSSEMGMSDIGQRFPPFFTWLKEGPHDNRGSLFASIRHLSNPSLPLRLLLAMSR